MKLTLGFALILVASASLFGQAAPASAPVPYSSVSQVNLLLSTVEETSQPLQRDLAALRIEKWKTDGNTKRGSQADMASIQRNLQEALPAMVADLRSSPDSLPATFKLYRNLDALYDVLVSLAESAGAFGSRDEYQALQNDVSSIEGARRMFADRMDALANSKETELTGLRNELQKLRAAEEAPHPVQKVVVDDADPAAPPVKKKSAHKARKPAPTTANPPTPTSQPPASTPPPQ